MEGKGFPSRDIVKVAWVAAIVLALASPLALADASVAELMEALAARGVTTGGEVRGAPGLADVGYGVRTEDYPCYVATLVNVFHVTFDGVPRPGMTVERSILAPEPPVPCGYGFESWLGEARGTVHADAYDWTACTAFEGGLGGWALVSDPCHVADFQEVVVSGRVGIATLADCWGDVCVSLLQVFGGTNNAPGHADVAFLRIA